MLFKTLEKYIDNENKDFDKKLSQHNKTLQEYRKQMHCEHDWFYMPDEEADSFCFSMEMPQRIICKKCKLELWNAKSTHPEDIKAIHHILIDLDVTPKPPLETR